jgi:threonine synthase
MLMLYLLENNMTTADFFKSVVYQQNVKSKTKQQTLDIMKSQDFFRLLTERGIRKKNNEHTNLKNFLQLSPSFPELMVLKSIKKTLEQMAENEEFMDAIREDIMYGEDPAMEGMDADEREAYMQEMQELQAQGAEDDD